MLRPNLTSSVATEGHSILLWTLREAPAGLLDDVFEHNAEMRDRFLKDWSGADVLVAVAWEMCAKSRALRLMENLLTRLTENGEQDVHWYAGVSDELCKRSSVQRRDAACKDDGKSLHRLTPVWDGHRPLFRNITQG